MPVISVYKYDHYLESDNLCGMSETGEKEVEGGMCKKEESLGREMASGLVSPNLVSNSILPGRSMDKQPVTHSHPTSNHPGPK